MTATQPENILNEVDQIVRKAGTLVGTVLPERVNREAVKCFGKLWKHKTIGKLSKAEFTNLKLSVGDLRYQCAWQGELVTQNLFKLDGLNFGEGSELKQVRKQLVRDALEVIRLSELLTTRVQKVQSFIDTMNPDLDSLTESANSPTPEDEMEEVGGDDGCVNDTMQVEVTPEQQRKEEERLMEESEAQEEDSSNDRGGDLDEGGVKMGSTGTPVSEVDREVVVPEYVARQYADRLVVVVDLPQGVNEEDVEVSYDGGILSVKGSVQRYVRVPQSPWGFTSMGMAVRSTPLLLRLNVSDAVSTNSLNTARVSASFKHGTLFVTFPKRVERMIPRHSSPYHLGGGAFPRNGCRPELRYRPRQEPQVGSPFWGQHGQRSPWRSGLWGPVVF